MQIIEINNIKSKKLDIINETNKIDNLSVLVIIPRSQVMPIDSAFARKYVTTVEDDKAIKTNILGIYES